MCESERERERANAWILFISLEVNFTEFAMKFGFQQTASDSARRSSSSSRRTNNGLSPDRRSHISTTSRTFSYCNGGFRGLKEYSKTVIDVDIFSNIIEDWIFERTTPNVSTDAILFKSPFSIDDLRRLDYALEGVLFQQLIRMSHSDTSREDQLLSLEDFLQTVILGLWRTFWRNSGPVPLSVSRYIVRDAVLVGVVIGAAVTTKSDSCSHIHWDQVLELALFKSDITQGTDTGPTSLSTSTLCEALFYGFHILMSRTLSIFAREVSSSVYLLVLDSKFGGVIKLEGDISKLETNSCNPYDCVGDWIKHHAEVSISPIERIWNKLGNANWGDLGSLQILLATFNTILQWKGPPRKSIASFVADHSLRMQKRSIARDTHDIRQKEVAIVDTCPILNPGDAILVKDDSREFRIKEVCQEQNCVSYSVVSLDRPDRLLKMHIGVHPSRIEPSWEATCTWYRVQRQAKVLSAMKRERVSCKHLPEVVSFGRISHRGAYEYGTTVLVTSPAGESVLAIVARDGPLSATEALRCCKDTLTALSSAAIANIQHGEIRPENIIRVSSPRAAPLYVLVSWGRAVIEDTDTPATHLDFSSIHALRCRKLCPSSDVESLVYVLYFICGGSMQHPNSIESAIQWRKSCWSKRAFQRRVGKVSTLLKAFADYVGSIGGTPYPVDYEIWLARLNRVLGSVDKGKSVESTGFCSRLGDIGQCSGTSGGA